MLLAALCEEAAPERVAEEIGGGGRGRAEEDGSPRRSTSGSAPIRARRAQYAQDRGYLHQVLREGNGRAVAVAEETLSQVREAMGSLY